MRTRLVLCVLVLTTAATACGKSKPDKAVQAAEGAKLFAANCAVCHGANGEGGVGPTLNAKEMLSVADDQQLRNIVRVGIPGTQMRSWSQEFGGPFTKDQVDQVVAYLRSWEPNAPSVPNWRQGKTSTTTPATPTSSP